MSKVALRVEFTSTYNVHAPLEENIESLTRVPCVCLPVTPNEPLQLAEELFN